MRATVVGGGLAGLSAALELVDAGHEVTLYEARPTLGGAVQTLPRREGDPEPPPDNGQHIALGCFEALFTLGEAPEDLGRSMRGVVVTSGEWAGCRGVVEQENVERP